MALYDNLFEPLALGPVTIPNRIVRSAHSVRLAGDALIAYHEARARGGVGMSTLEASSVHPDAPSSLPVHSDDILPFYREVSRRMHEAGSKVLIQLYHPGASARNVPSLSPPWGVSEIPNPTYNVMPMAITKGMIDELVAYFAAAARRVRDGGLDGIDIHASSGYLIHEFLSPALNKRTDQYGGSFDNRLRLLREIISAIRDAIGHDIALGVRLPNDDFVVGGLDPAANARIAQAIEADVDYISLHMGSYWRWHKLMGPTDEPLGLEMASNKPITSVLSKPRMVVGRIMTLDHASAIVRDGEGDMVSMVRALIADPQLVNKARRGEEHRIRPCISTNVGCHGLVMTKGIMSCVVNQFVGKELSGIFDVDGKASTSKKILVVGGGPAGLEAARTAAIRGHKVELHEATGRLGGQVALARLAPRRGDVGLITDYLASELEILGVEIHYDSLVDADMVAEIAPDEVVVATGTTPRSDGWQVALPADVIPGHDLPHVYNSWDVFGFGNRVSTGKSAVVFDDKGSFEALSVAEMLLKTGTRVTLVSRFEKMGETVPFPPVTVGAIRERLLASDFEFIGGYYMKEITPEAVDIGVLYVDPVRTIPADTVVLVGYNIPNRELLDDLSARGIKAHAVGDLLGRGDLLTAIHSGTELAAAL